MAEALWPPLEIDEPDRWRRCKDLARALLKVSNFVALKRIEAVAGDMRTGKIDDPHDVFAAWLYRNNFDQIHTLRFAVCAGYEGMDDLWKARIGEAERGSR